MNSGIEKKVEIKSKKEAKVASKKGLETNLS